MPWRKGNRLHAVTEQQAGPEIGSLYREIRTELGLPFVPLLYQVYGSYPQFLKLHWASFRSIAGSGEFLQLAERLRADAYTRAHNYFDITDISAKLIELEFSEGAERELKAVIEMFNFSNPLLLLISAAQQQAFDGPIGTGQASRSRPERSEFEVRPIFVAEDTEEAAPRRVFEALKHVQGLALVPLEMRALARWPDFLQLHWENLRPQLESPLYLECEFGIHESAWSLARELPGSMETTLDQMTAAGMSEEDVASVVRLTQAFTKCMSSTLLNGSIAKIAMEGGNRVESGQMIAALQPFSTPDQAA